MLSALADVAPGLLPLARLIYGREGRLVLPNHAWKPGEDAFKVFLSRCGSRQGDPWGPVLFALGMMTAMKKVQATHPTVEFPSFVDDVDALPETTASAAGASVDAVHATLSSELGAIGIRLNVPKTHTYTPSGVPIVTAAGITQARDGITTMGVPVGAAAFKVAKARKRLANSFKQLELLPEFHFGDAMRMLGFCVSKRVTFLAGSLAPDVFLPIAMEWDAAIRVCLTRMFKGAPPHPRCHLAGPGGLGIAVVAKELSLLRCLSAGRAVNCNRAHLPRLAPLTVPSAPPTHPVHIEIQAAWDALPDAVTAAYGGQGFRNPLTKAGRALAPHFQFGRKRTSIVVGRQRPARKRSADSRQRACGCSAAGIYTGTQQQGCFSGSSNCASTSSGLSEFSLSFSEESSSFVRHTPPGLFFRNGEPMQTCNSLYDATELAILLALLATRKSTRIAGGRLTTAFIVAHLASAALGCPSSHSKATYHGAS